MGDGKPEKGKFRDDEVSDLFSVKPFNSGSAIPKSERVPLAKDEIRRRRLVRVSWITAAVIAAGLIAWLAIYLVQASRTASAIAAAGDDGRVASIRAALDLLGDDDEERAIAMRLRAMLVLAGERESVEELERQLATVPSTGEAGAQRTIAQTYLALARGDLRSAMQHASQVAAQGDYASEAAHARAMAARAVGNVEGALAASRITIEQRPEAPRYVALHAELMARGGDSAAALARLDELPADRVTPGVRIARARIRDAAGVAIAEIASEARAVLEDEAATTHEKVWARLLLARAAATSGDRVEARRLLDEASRDAPPGDELFTLALCEAALRIGADRLAQTSAERLPTPLTVDAGRRAQLSAELALAAHDLRTAEAALGGAPADPRTALARARLLEARGQYDAARPLYREASADASLRVPATVALASMELEHGHAPEAVALARPLLEQFPNHPDVVPVAVEAQLGIQQAQPAMQLVTPALALHPRDARLHAAKAHVQIALEQWQQALTTLEEAIGLEEDDADLHADRGRAAAHLGRLDVARQAYDRALELSASHPVALVGRLELDVDAMSLGPGREIMDRVDRAEVRSLHVEHLRARLLAMEIAGRSGTTAVRDALREHDDDHLLTMCLGWLYMQAEDYSRAMSTFGRLTSGDTPQAEAVLARTLAMVRMRMSTPAKSALDAWLETHPPESLPARERALLVALQARLALAEDQRGPAQRLAREAIALDGDTDEAHLVLADLLIDQEQDPSEPMRAALRGPHPSSRPLAVLAIREEPPSPEACAYAERYRRAAPGGQYGRGVARTLRDCRR
ncbi:MAG: tetratricopeptide repeat protein [Sandaracinaceae bacterium]|nr:tetratricopeptide repeat protein [Sandaracinaceae bacterium]